MSETTQVFVGTDLPLDEFAVLLGQLLALEFVRVDYGSESEWVAIKGDDARITLQTHDYVNDGTIEFDRYRYCVDVKGLDPEWPAREERERAVAHDIFARLKRDGRFPPAMTWALQVKLDEFEPAEP